MLIPLQSVALMAQRSHVKFFPRGPFVSITLAQYGIESAWGDHMSGLNNPFGIKATANQIAYGAFTACWTHETLHGQYVKVIQKFANYPSLEEGFDAHAILLTTPYYQRCVEAKTPEEYAQALWKCGYATGEPGHPYDEALIKIIFDMDLKRFDVFPTS
jgi:flagellum-specific peptidoglycan hydrolase FlgJ